jgi:LCP family protein required for cell wall assembly
MPPDFAAQPIYVPPPSVPRRHSSGGCNGLSCCVGGCTFTASFMVCCILGLVLYALVAPAPTNILILGSDARPGDPAAEAARTDTIMVLGVNPPKHKVSLFSLPRDVFIESPGYGWLRANTVVRNAEISEPGTGIDQMILSMETTFQMEIDHYAQVNFEGFVDVVDALGGVEIDVPYEIIDNAYPTENGGTMRVEFQPGKQHMDGETALIYARTRHSDDDYQRANRQQQVMDAIFSKLRNPLNAYRIPAVLNAFYDHFESDMSFGEMLAVMPGILLYGYNPDGIDRFVVDRDYLYLGSSGEAMPNVDLIAPWIESHLE